MEEWENRCLTVFLIDVAALRETFVANNVSIPPKDCRADCRELVGPEFLWPWLLLLCGVCCVCPLLFIN